MKLTFLVLISLLVISCGGGSNSGTESASAVDPNKIYIKILKFTGKYSIDGPPMEGVIVQLDDNGQNFTSDVNGDVTIDITDSEQHDIHIFSPPGYGWESINNVEKGIINKFQLAKLRIPPDTNLPKKSYVSLTGQITGFNPDNSYEFSFYNKDTGSTSRVRAATIRSNPLADYEIDIQFTVDPATTINGEVLVSEYGYDNITTEITLIDSVILPVKSYSTSATVGSFVTQDINLLRGKQAQSNIITVKDINIPADMELNNFSLDAFPEGSFTNIKEPIENLISNSTRNVTELLKTFTSYTSYDYPLVAYTVVANLPTTIGAPKPYRLRWKLTSEVPRYSNVNIIPRMIVLPDFPANQSGDIISWSKIDKNLTSLRLTIFKNSEPGAEVIWNIHLDPLATELKLPQLPTGSSLLTVGQNYKISLRGDIRDRDHRELFRLNSDTWKR